MTAATGDERGRAGREHEPLVRWEELLPTAMGAAIAALLLSRLGVAGTIAGAACTPVIITVTSATIRRQMVHARERAGVWRGARSASAWARIIQRLPRGRPLSAALLTAAVAFVLVAAAITIAEGVAGKPVSDWGRRGVSGYSFGGGATTARPVASPMPASPVGGRRAPEVQTTQTSTPRSTPSPTQSSTTSVHSSSAATTTTVSSTTSASRATSSPTSSTTSSGAQP